MMKPGSLISQLHLSYRLASIVYERSLPHFSSALPQSCLMPLVQYQAPKGELSYRFKVPFLVMEFFDRINPFSQP